MPRSNGGPNFETQALHAGENPDPETGSRVPPLHQTTSYVFPDAETAADRFALESDDHVYSRISNPTVATLERRLAALGGGSDAVATASGMAAFDALVFVLASAGDNVVTATDLYGGTTAYLSHTASRRGVETRFVPTDDPDAFAGAIDSDTAFVHAETLGNPSLVTPDLERVARVAHDRGVPFVVDNTFASPALCSPIDYGADAVWHSTTKWIHGGGTTIGGVLIDGGEFPWLDHPDRFPEIAAENPAYRGVTFARDFQDAPLAAAARFRGLRSLGNAQSPFDAWLTLQGVETLPLRMARHCENASIVAEFLDDHPAVEWVRYPGLETHTSHEQATRYLDGGYGGMIAFGLAGGYEAGRRFCESVDLSSFLANVGDAKTLVIHPASTTHSQLTPEEQREAGVSPDLVRLSVGLEHPDDVLADLDAAIAATR